MGSFRELEGLFYPAGYCSPWYRAEGQPTKWVRSGHEAQNPWSLRSLMRAISSSCFGPLATRALARWARALSFP
jgi:hypothetical protein